VGHLLDLIMLGKKHWGNQLSKGTPLLGGLICLHPPLSVVNFGFTALVFSGEFKPRQKTLFLAIPPVFEKKKRGFF